MCDIKNMFIVYIQYTNGAHTSKMVHKYLDCAPSTQILDLSLQNIHET